MTSMSARPADHEPRWSPRKLVGGVEHEAGLDGPAAAIGDAVRALVPEGPALALRGQWFGHPVHPALTDVVVGTWVSASVLDLAGGRRRSAADLLVGIGVLSALPTALTGACDWAACERTDERVRRVGVVHAVGNTTALALQALSLRARRGGRRGRGVSLSLLANGVAAGSAYLGGHLTYARGVGVDDGQR